MSSQNEAPGTTNAYCFGSPAMREVCAAQSSFAPEALTTLLHFATSLFT